jgi:DNA-binding CsgD family transcriptional regulator
VSPYRGGGAWAYDPAIYLPRRERDVLQAMASGAAVPEMARRWHVSVATVKTQQANLYRRLGAVTGPHAVAEAFRRGILAVDPDVTAAAALLAKASELGYRLAVVRWPADEEAR